MWFIKHRPTNLEKVAYHEAGHAFASITLCYPFEQISIIPNPVDGSLGRTTRPMVNMPEEEGTDHKQAEYRIRKWVRDQIVIILCGEIAENYYAGQSDWRGAENDTRKVKNMAEYLCSDSEQQANLLLDRLWDLSERMVTDPRHWSAIETLAKELLIQKEIEYSAARRIIGDSLKQSIPQL